MVSFADDPTTISNITNAYFASPDTPAHRRAAALLFSSDPAYGLAFATDNGYATTYVDSDSYTETTIDTTSLYNYLKTQDAEFFYDLLYKRYGENPENIRTWLSLVTADTTLISPTWDDSIHFSSLLSYVLGNYGRTAANLAAVADSASGGTGDTSQQGIYAFASWMPGAMDTISSSVTDAALMRIAYNDDQVGFLAAATAGNDAAMDTVNTILGNARVVDAIEVARNLGFDYAALFPWLAGNPQLKSQELSLASHHIYGSSRLGIDQYWPTQFNAVWDYKTSIIDTARLLNRGMWYSYALNDSYNVGGDHNTATHVLGQKQYEETNQLGNVMATVSDKRYIHTSAGRRTYFSAALPAVYDYYPFGMPMKERTSMDTSGQAMYSTQQITTPNIVTKHGIFTTAGGADAYGSVTGVVSFGPQIVGAVGPSGGLTKTAYGLWPGVPAHVEVQVVYIAGGTSAGATVTVTDDSTGLLYGSVPANSAQPANFVFLPQSSRIVITVNSPHPHASNTMLMQIQDVIWSQHQGGTTYSQAVVISNKLKDRYEFGMNTQMKTNEIAGVGEHLTALFGEYDPRTARRWNLDPRPSVSLSGYSVFANSPIHNFDILLDTLSTANYADALRLAANMVSERMVSKQYDYYENGVLNKRIVDYAIKHDLSSEDFHDFNNLTNHYYYAMGSLATYSQDEFKMVNRSVINDKHITDNQRLRISLGAAGNAYRRLWGIMLASANAAGFVATLGAGTPALSQSRASSFSAEREMTLENPNSFAGRSTSEVGDWLTQNGWKNNGFTRGGAGFKYTNGKFGEQIRLMPGYGTGSRPNQLKWGPYMETSINGQKNYIPLSGNPTLK